MAGHPERCAPSIHIAGSKGKGSVTSMLASMLTAAGFRAARYMSPHVTDIRERICISSGKNAVSFFSEDVYCSAGDELRYTAEVLLPAAAAQQAASQQAAALFDECEPTFWELLTLLFFLCARQAKCDVMIVETGMGGRLDSTNVVDPLVSVITLIELEHTNFLGDTITAIAGEKAGIIKQGKPLILAKQCDEALEVFKKKIHEKNCQLFYFPEIAELSDINITPQGTEFSLSPTLRLSIPIPGKVQAENAALAITALKTAFPEIGEEVIRSGLANLKMPARFEKIANEPAFIIDGAHTPESLAFCVETFCSLYGEGGILIFGCAADKDITAMANIIHTNSTCSRFSKIIITTPGTFKISDPSLVYETFASIAGKEKTVLIPDTQEAVKLAKEYARESEETSLPILGTGSFYLAAEIRKIIINS